MSSLLKGWRSLIGDKGQTETDWFLSLARWGLLACILAVGLLDPEHHISPSNLALLVIAVGAYNLVVTVLSFFRLFPQELPTFTLVVDTTALIVLLNLSGGTDSPFYVFPLFPILVATLRFSWQAGLLAAGVFVLTHIFQTALTWDAGLGTAQLFSPALRILLFVFTVVVASVATRQLSARGATRWDTLADGQSSVPERIRLIYEMASSLSATLNYRRVLEAILDISRLGFDELGHRVGESVGVVLLYDSEGFLAPAAHRNLVVHSDEGRRIRGRRGIVEQAIALSEAVIGKAPADDSELRAFHSMKLCQSMICVPLRAGFETYGVVLFASVKPMLYTAEHVELLTIFCNQATIALQNATLYQNLREERDKIIHKEEQARTKLARDLHDGPTQDVAAIAMRLNFARLLVERDPARARAELERLEDLAHRTVKEIRSMLFTLRPVILETEGLVAALHQYADNLRENNGLSVGVDAEGYKECMDTDTQGVVFAILEEAINNSKKHAEASRVWVHLQVRDDMFVARVADNGRGFDVEAVERDYASSGSLGMLNLKERAALIGGTLNIESSPGQGTRVTLLVPLSEESI